MAKEMDENKIMVITLHGNEKCGLRSVVVGRIIDLADVSIFGVDVDYKSWKG